MEFCTFVIPPPARDWRPVVWPPTYPYRMREFREDGGVFMYAYVTNQEELLRLWPEAIDITSDGPQTEIYFSNAWPRPGWYTGPGTDRGW